ncbi:hypothetical protein FG91_01705 [Sphingopyxis sp. LC81]|uniref:hypothetical protein n=1 Tax=Sphingopyxis sp. LC81 TaxID=1502850 RepID=UPI00050E5153|nr:hypothetical protein [Sphingopyxis sp. LC81]KGB54805.1 hypothetical protein FG91_01705 [Sphingopyxis sp. LC81]
MAHEAAAGGEVKVTIAAVLPFALQAPAAAHILARLETKMRLAPKLQMGGRAIGWTARQEATGCR